MRMAAPHRTDHLYFDRAKLVLKTFGILPRPDDTIVYKAYRCGMVGAQYAFLLFQAYYIALVRHDLEAACEASYLFFTQASLCFKVTVFLFNVDRFEELSAMMNCDTFKPQNDVHDWSVRRHAATIKRLMAGFMVLSQATCGLWALRPLFDNAGDRTFPFKMWMPVDPAQSPQYEIGYAFQYLTICVSAFMYFGVDSVALGALIFARAQLDIIKLKILKIEPSNRKIKGVGADDRRDNHYESLIEIVVHHQTVIEFTKMLESTYHTYLFFQLCGSVAILCVSCMRLVTVEWCSVQFVSMVSYLVAMLTQLYVSCWCGHELSAASVALPVALYAAAARAVGAGRFRRGALFAMMRTQRPLVFRLGHYIPLSRQTFVTVLRTSYSYFAFLNRANK